MNHTSLLYQQVDVMAYNILTSELNKLSKDKSTRHYPDSKCNSLHVYELYKNQGIIILLRKARMNWKIEPNGKDIYYHAIEIRINPKVLINKNQYIQVAKAADYKRICKMFETVLEPLQEKFQSVPSLRVYEFNSIHQYQVKRIDYCINISSQLHERYMQLIMRSVIPAYFKEIKYTDKKSKRRRRCEDSFYIQSKSVCINIYNKKRQLEKKFNQYDFIEEAKNIIRIEVQCFSSKTSSMKQKNNWRYRDFVNFFNEDIARKIIYDYYQKAVGLEDYYTLEGARGLVKASNHRKSTKEEMIEVLELINQKRSVQKALEAYCTDTEDEDERLLDIKRFNKIVKKIRGIGVNPVTIPIHWGISYLPNLVYEIDKEFTPILMNIII